MTLQDKTQAVVIAALYKFTHFEDFEAYQKPIYDCMCANEVLIISLEKTYKKYFPILSEYQFHKKNHFLYFHACNTIARIKMF